MSEELRRGIPKAIKTGEKKVVTNEDLENGRQSLEKIMKQFGRLKENESIKDFKHPK